MISHKPFTLVGTGTTSMDLRLEATSWEIPAGHHLVLAIDTVDPRYRGRSVLGTSVTFSSPAADPSWITVPVAA